MPNKPCKPCAHYGCIKLTTERLCLDHAKEYDQQRGSPTARGYNYRWVQARNAFLRKNPLCAICATEGIITRATCVDHVIPHKSDMQLFWNVDNWQSLCYRHHSQKTMRELNEGGGINSL